MQTTEDLNGHELLETDTLAPEKKLVFTPEEFAEKMVKITKRTGEDYKQCHILMDDLMCNLLRFMGYGKGVDIFDDIEKWYA